MGQVLVRRRHDDAPHPSGNTAIESFDLGVEPDLRNQPEGGS